jgi:hypothetical protein
MDGPKEPEGIWLEVVDVGYETNPKKVSVQLKGDREHPKPAWWPVVPTSAGKDVSETYKAILNEMDKKRTVLARLSYVEAGLQCTAFRFLSPELGSR